MVDNSSRLRVAFIDHTAKLSGGEIALARLIPGIPGIEAIVILGEDGPLVPELQNLGITVQILPLGSLGQVKKDAVGGVGSALSSARDTAGYVIALTRLLVELRVDVVHTNSLKAGYLGCTAARLAGIPSVWHLRDRLSNDYLPKRAVTLTRFAIKILPDAMIANSHTTARTVRDVADQLVIPSPVVHDPYETRSGKPRLEDRDAMTVGLVGRLAAWKGQDLFLRAFAAACPAPSRHRAVVVGSAMFGEDDFACGLVRLAESLGISGRVEMRGFRHDISAELARMDVLVHASVIPEPFGQVVVQGMAAGVPVVAADAGGPAEIVTHGENGLLYEMGSVGELTNVLRTVIADAPLREHLVAGGLVRAGDFSPERTGRAVRSVYDGVLAERSARGSALRSRRMSGSKRLAGIGGSA